MTADALLSSAESGGLASIRAQEAQPKPELRPSPGLGSWLRDVGGSVCFTTYQSARMFFLFADGNAETVAQERIVGSAMGMAINEHALWISNKEQVWRFSNVGGCKVKDEDWQAVYMPRKGYFLGGCDTHDIVPGARIGTQGFELAFVNTAWICVAAIAPHFAFQPIWKPPFITALSPEDRCHLNGLGTRDGELAYVTLVWRVRHPYRLEGGEERRRHGDGHAHRRGAVPRLVHAPQPALAQGPVVAAEFRHRRFRLSGWRELRSRLPVPRLRPRLGLRRRLRGDRPVAAARQHLRQRHGHQGAAEHPARCGLIIVDLNSGKIVHWLSIRGVISELYDVTFLPGITRPYTPGFSEPDLHRSVAHPRPGTFSFAPPRPQPEDRKSAPPAAPDMEDPTP